MKILICPGAFKETLTAGDAGEAMARGICRRYGDEIWPDVAPMADGGDGTLDALAEATNSGLVDVHVCGPVGKNIAAQYLLFGDGSVVIESARAAGLALVPPGERDPWTATTLGVGEMAMHALLSGASEIYITVGGSATNDGGIGFAQALGFRFLDASGADIAEQREQGYGPSALVELDRIDTSGCHPGIEAARFRGLVDVWSPFVGPGGASHLYGAQKGADASMIARLDDALERFAEIIERDLGVDVRNTPGSGAGGGLGGALIAFAGAKLDSGAAFVAEQIQLEERMSDKDLVITGEGRIDRQTSEGKTVQVVAGIAKRLGVRAVAIAGTIDRSLEEDPIDGLSALIPASTGPEKSVEELRPIAAGLVADAAATIELTVD